MTSKRKTAAELMAELQNDSEFRRKEQEAEQRQLLKMESYAKLMQPVLSRLGEAGFVSSSLQEIVKNFAPLPPNAVEILIKALVEVGDARAKEAIVRTLAAANQSFDGRPLVECFDKASDEALRWAILNTVALVHPHSIDAWTKKIHGTPYGDILRDLS